MVVVQHFEEIHNIGSLKPPNVVFLVDVAGGRADHDQILEEFRALNRGEGPNHGAYGMTDEGDACEGKLPDNLKNVIGISLESAVPGPVKRSRVGKAGTDIIE
jgi:hypothetical protein